MVARGIERRGSLTSYKSSQAYIGIVPLKLPNAARYLIIAGWRWAFEG